MIRTAKLISKLFFFVSFIFIFFTSTAQSEIEFLDLKTCIDYALKNAISVQNAQIDVLKTDKQRKEIIGLGLPQINIEASFTDNVIIQNIYLPAQSLALFSGDTVEPNAPDVPVQFGTRFNGNVIAKLSQLVVDSRYFIGLKAINSIIRYSKQQLQQNQEQLIYDITKAYYAILINEEQRKVFKANLENLDTLLKQTEELFKNGYALNVDVSRLKVSYNNLKTEQKKLDNLLQISKNALKLRMGKPIETPIKLTEEIDTTSLLNFQLIASDFHFDRTDYKILTSQRILNDYDIQQHKSGYYPSLYFDLAYGYNAGSATLSDFSPNNYAYWGLRLSIPISNGGQRRNKVAQLKLDDKKIELTQEFFKKQIRFEQEEAILNFNNTMFDVQNQKDNIILAQEVYDISILSYREGVGSSTDIVSAHTSYKESQNNYYSSLLNLLIAKLDYEKAFGKIKIPNLEE